MQKSFHTCSLRARRSLHDPALSVATLQPCFPVTLQLESDGSLLPFKTVLQRSWGNLVCTEAYCTLDEVPQMGDTR
jgi:hypothetical protein